MNHVYHLNTDLTCTLYQVWGDASIDPICTVVNEEQCKELIAELVAEHGCHAYYTQNNEGMYNLYVSLVNGDEAFICTITNEADADAIVQHFD